MKRTALLVNQPKKVKINKDFYTRYLFDLSLPILMKTKDNTDETFVVWGLLVYLNTITFQLTVGYLNENGYVELDKVPNTSFMSHEKSVFEDMVYNLKFLDSVDSAVIAE